MAPAIHPSGKAVGTINACPPYTLMLLPDCGAQGLITSKTTLGEGSNFIGQTGTGTACIAQREFTLAALASRASQRP